MKKNRLKQWLLCSTFLICSLESSETLSNPQQELSELYEHHALTPSDINEHVPVLRKLAKECSSVVEIGTRNMISTWGIIQGLSESSFSNRFYHGIDLKKPPLDKLYLIRRLANENGIAFHFQEANDMHIDIPNTDMLFIDSLHTYAHLTYELNKFASSVNKYITMHDTSPPWGYKDDNEYSGNYSEYPNSINRTKKGLWAAVEDFLSTHPDWVLLERRFNNHGFTILKRQ